MKRKFLILAAILAVALMAAPASAVTFTGTDAAGDPVSASANFIFGTDTVTVELTNTLTNIKNAGQVLSDLFFTVSTGQTVGSMTSSSGALRIINAGNTFTNDGSGSTGWTFAFSNGTFHLDGLDGAQFVPSHTIIPDQTSYAANASIAGNGPHNPFLYGPVDFVLSMPGVTAQSTATNVAFSFGTEPSTVPIPPSALLLGSGLLGLVGLGWRRKKS